MKCASAVAGLVAVLLAIAVPSASATEYGSVCSAGSSGKFGEPVGVQVLRAPGAPSPTITAPGVVTKWKVAFGDITARLVTLKVFNKFANEYEAIAAGATETVANKQTKEFAARIPVPAGAYFGLASSDGAPYCAVGGVSGDSVVFVGPDPPVGARANGVAGGTLYLLPLLVTVEPDADGDGFGDETQDACPSNPMTQGTCPVIDPPPTGGGSGGGGTGGGGGATALALSLKAKLEGNVVAVQVTGADRATVAVSDQLRGRKVAGPTSTTIEPGKVGRAYLPLSKALKAQLAALPRKRHLNLVIEASGRSAAGATDSASIELALPGRKKAQQHHAAHTGAHRTVRLHSIRLRRSCPAGLS
jgi:hypothetical protein